MKDFLIGLTITLMLPFVVYYGAISFSPAAGYHNQSKEAFFQRLEATLQGKKLDQSSSEAEYAAGKKTFNKHLFYIAVPAGVLAIVAGLLFSLPGIGSGLMFGGLITLVYGYFTYWEDLPVKIKFISLLVGLILLIAAGWWDHKKKLAKSHY